MREVLVIGGGISGLALAHALETAGIDFMLAQAPVRNHASVIAAGLINPVTGRRYSEQKHLSMFMEAANACYDWYAAMCGQTFSRPIPIVRIHRSADAVAMWQQIRYDSSTLTSTLADSDWPELPIDRTFGGVQIKGGMIIDTGKLYDAGMGWLANHQKLYHHYIQYSDIKIFDTHFQTPAGDFRHLIQADGMDAAESPWWKEIPFRRNRGEILMVRIPDMKEDLVSIRDCILVPQGDNLFWVGAYNTWDQLPPVPTEAGKAFLENDLKEMLTAPYELVNHICGVRPTVRDRTPVSGTHPQHRHLHLLNGMGTKGYSMAPWHAQNLVAHIFHGATLPKTTDVQRFY